MNPPKQPRSEAVLERILDTTERMLVQRRFHEISINDLCIEAEISVSSLYARFPSKDAILLAIIERLAERVQQRIEAVGATVAEWPELDLPTLTRILVAEMILFARAEDHIEIAATQEPLAQNRLREVHNGTVRSALDVAAIVIPLDAETARAVEFAVRSVGAIVHRSVGSNVRFATEMSMDDDELITRTSELILSYVSPFLAD